MNKKDTHIVLKMDDVRKYLSDEQIYELNNISQIIQNGREKDGKNKCNEYYICNVDEPYSDKVLDVILNGTSLDDIKAEINQINIQVRRETETDCGEMCADDMRKMCLNIIDKHIGERSEDDL